MSTALVLSDLSEKQDLKGPNCFQVIWLHPRIKLKNIYGNRNTPAMSKVRFTVSDIWSKLASMQRSTKVQPTKMRKINQNWSVRDRNVRKQWMKTAIKTVLHTFTKTEDIKTNLIFWLSYDQDYVGGCIIDVYLYE